LQRKIGRSKEKENLVPVVHRQLPIPALLLQQRPTAVTIGTETTVIIVVRLLLPTLVLLPLQRQIEIIDVREMIVGRHLLPTLVLQLRLKLTEITDVTTVEEETSVVRHP
jgi:hypothetical protein